MLAALSLLIPCLYGCAFSPSGILAVGGDDQAVTLLDSSKYYEVSQTFTELSEYVRI